MLALVAGVRGSEPARCRIDGMERDETLVEEQNNFRVLVEAVTDGDRLQRALSW